MIPAFRLCKTRHLATAFSGHGARLTGGRWNSPGLPVVYTSSSLSLATLEVLVHLEDPAVLAGLFSWLPVEIPELLVERPEVDLLGPAWLDEGALPRTRAIGDAWLRAQRSAVLAVPSAVTPQESNYLLNPTHPRFPEILIGPACRFQPDRRLID
jgi:RES domain-containing protein